jgi:predicted phage terminase large subunit-like protein
MPAAIDALSRLEARLQHDATINAAVTEPDAGTFHDFITHVAPEVEHHHFARKLSDVLQRVADGSLQRLIIQCPPRHGKSLQSSRLFPAYYLRRHPERWVGLASYGAELATGFSRVARSYYAASGGTIDPSSKAADRWETGRGGGMWSAGVGGALTGRGGSLLVVDDPVKGAAEADSPTYRQRLKDWWESVLRSRLEPGGAIVVIMTRWHEDDLVGHLLELERETTMPEHWHVVDLPAIAHSTNDGNDFPPTCTIEPDWRQPGEPLCPERYPLPELQKIKASSTARNWLALYQQQPTAGAGSVFFREWFRYYDTAPQRFARLIGSIDCTFKDSDGSDFVALSVWGQNPDGMYLLDMANRRLSFTNTMDLIVAMAGRWRWSELLVEDAANGAAVIDTLSQKALGYAVRAVKPLGGKVARANACTIEFEQGRVWFPREAPWLRSFENQLLSFPTGAHDDMVDTTTMAINYVQGSGPMRVSTAVTGHGQPGYQQPRDQAMRVMGVRQARVV